MAPPFLCQPPLATLRIISPVASSSRRTRPLASLGFARAGRRNQLQNRRCLRVSASTAEAEYGRPEDDVADDFYSVLGVMPDATPEEIKKAYYSCMKACHPDLSGDDPDVTNFCMFINEVYTVLSDPVQRAVYDEIHGYTATATNPFFDDSAPKDHVFVDEFTCIGCKNCANVCPDVFEIEEDFGRSRVYSQSGNTELIQDAIDSCPVDCIHWTSAAQLSLLENEMRRVERVNVGLMSAGMGVSVDVFRMGDKTIIKFEGDHNSPRPQSYYDSVSVFFYNTLRPPQLPAACSSKLNMGAFKVGTLTNENLFLEILNGLRAAGTEASSSSREDQSLDAPTSVIEFMSENMNQLSIKNDNDLDFLLDENYNFSGMDDLSAGSHLQDKKSRQNEESCSYSYTSSNRESWGRCSSLGSASDVSISSNRHKQENMTVNALATPLRQKQRKSPPKTKEKIDKKMKEKTKVSLWKKLKREKEEMGGSLSRSFKICLGQSPRHKKSQSSGISLRDP